MTSFIHFDRAIVNHHHFDCEMVRHRLPYQNFCVKVDNQINVFSAIRTSTIHVPVSKYAKCVGPSLFVGQEDVTAFVVLPTSPPLSMFFT